MPYMQVLSLWKARHYLVFQNGLVWLEKVFISSLLWAKVQLSFMHPPSMKNLQRFVTWNFCFSYCSMVGSSSSVALAGTSGSYVCCCTVGLKEAVAAFRPLNGFAWRGWKAGVLEFMVAGAGMKLGVFL